MVLSSSNINVGGVSISLGLAVVNTQRLASAFSLSRDTSNIKQDILRYNISKWTSPLLRRHTSLHSGIRLSPASTLDRTFGILYRNEGFHVALHWRFWSGRSHRRTHQSCESQELDQIYMEFGNTRWGWAQLHKIPRDMRLRRCPSSQVSNEGTLLIQ